MRHSASFHPSSLDIRVIWANMHRWNAGSEYAQPMVCHALWLVQKGDVEISDDEQSWTVSAGDMLLWPHNNFRRIKALCNSQWLSLGLSVWALGHLDVLNWLGLPRVWRPAPEEYDLLQNWINQIIAAVRVPRAIASNEFFTSVDAEHISEYSHQSNQMQHAFATHLLREGLARAIVARCWNHLSAADLATVLATHAPSWIQGTLEKMREAPHSSVEELAQHAGFSPAQFRRRFQAATGSTPRDYLSRIRLEKARTQLETTDLPVRAIAAQCGFDSVPHFIRMFEKKTGWSPARYRASVLRGHV